MFNDDRITTATIEAVFVEEIAARHGKISDTFEDGRRLFLRSVLTEVAEVRAKDHVQGGVALRSNGSEVWVHPYVFRQVCGNGAIIAQAIQTRHIADVNAREPDEVLPELREAIQACALPEAFAAAVEQMRSARHAPIDLALTMMPLIHRFPATVVSQIMRHVFEDGDQSAFGLANAITATARDASDPEVRWNLEELGGGVLANPNPRSPRSDGSAARRPEVIAVGSSHDWE